MIATRCLVQKQILAVLTLRGQQDLFGPVDLQADKVGRAALREEKFALVFADVEDGVVTPRVVDEWDVDVAGQALVDDLEILDQSIFLILVLCVRQNSDTQVCQRLNKVRSRFKSFKRIGSPIDHLFGLFD